MGDSESRWSRFIGKLAEGVVVGIIAGLIVAILTPALLVRATREVATCDSPTGLRPVPMAKLILDKKVTVTAAPREGGRRNAGDDARLFHPWKAFDGRTRSAWAEYRSSDTLDNERAALEAAQDRRDKPLATMNVTWVDGAEVDVRLACIVNGVPLDDASYRRADRLRSVTIRTNCSDGGPSTVQLRSQAVTELQHSQSLGFRCTDLRSMTLQVRSVYDGEAITDPRTGQRLGPSTRLAVAEITLFEPDPGQPRGLVSRFAEWVASSGT
jgi:hypothetical protein